LITYAFADIFPHMSKYSKLQSHSNKSKKINVDQKNKSQQILNGILLLQNWQFNLMQDLMKALSKTSSLKN